MAAMPSPVASRCPLTSTTPCAGSRTDVTKARALARGHLPSEKGSAQNPAVGTDLQCILILRILVACYPMYPIVGMPDVLQMSGQSPRTRQGRNLAKGAFIRTALDRCWWYGWRDRPHAGSK
jgi:hypothetical protein